jgi:hypothetical protein
MAKPVPNFRRLDSSNRDIAVLIGAMLQARQAVERRSWASPQDLDIGSLRCYPRDTRIQET